jgi:peroxiredoxin
MGAKLITFLLICVLFACQKDRNNFKIQVVIEDSDGQQVYLARRTLSGTMPVDSAMPDKAGVYKLRGYTQKPDFYIVYQKAREYINLIVHPGDNFRVLTHTSPFGQNYLIEGSKDSRLIQKLVTMQTRTLERITEISNEFENNIGKPGFDTIKARIDSTYEKIVAEHRRFSIQLIEENPQSLAGLMALYQQLGKRIPVFDYKKDFRYYKFVDSNLSALYPGSEAILDLDRKVADVRKSLQLEIGVSAPSLALPDTSGQTIKLSTLRGKYVLLVFWASWSEQSIHEIQMMTPLLIMYRDKGLESYLVSLDRKRDSWIRGIHELESTGRQVSDLKYWDSPVVEAYQIKQLPLLYLINPDGRIVAKEFSAEGLPQIINGLF